MTEQEREDFLNVTLEGTVVAADRPPSADQMLAITRRYLPEEYAQASDFSDDMG